MVHFSVNHTLNFCFTYHKDSQTASFFKDENYQEFFNLQELNIKSLSTDLTYVCDRNRSPGQQTDGKGSPFSSDRDTVYWLYWSATGWKTYKYQHYQNNLENGYWCKTKIHKHNRLKLYAKRRNQCMFNLENDRPISEVEGTGVSGLILLVISIFSSKNRQIFSSSSNCKWKFTFVRFKSLKKNIAFYKFYSTYPGISIILQCDFKQQVTNHQINLRNMQMPLYGIYTCAVLL